MVTLLMIAPLVASLRRRWFIRQVWRRWLLWLPAGWGMALAGSWLISGMTPWQWGVGGALGALLSAMLMEGIRLPTLRAFALELDRRYQSGDRLVTGLALQGAEGEMERAALKACEVWAIDFRPSLPWNSPKWALWAVIPLALLFWTGMPESVEIPAGRDVESANAAARLESLAASLPKEGEVAQELAAALAKTAGALRHRPASPEARREMLRELSLLEEALTGGNLPMEGLAETFQAEDEALSEAFSKKDAGQIAQRLEQMAEAGTSPSMGAAMEKAAQATDGTALARAAQRAAQAMKKGDKEASRDALRQMAEAVRQAAGEESTRQRLSQTINEMKNPQSEGNEPPAAGSPEGSENEEGSGVLVERGTPPEGDGILAQGGEGQEAGGVPGSENDKGQKASPFGPSVTSAPDPAVLKTRLQGALGEGESLHSLIATQGGEASARREYRQLYEAARPAAEEALDKETIPLGSRLLIRRYFEAIRPNP